MMGLSISVDAIGNFDKYNYRVSCYVILMKIHEQEDKYVFIG